MARSKTNTAKRPNRESASAHDERWLRFYRQMLKIRLFEEEVNQLYLGAKLPGLAHLYIGEEAVAVGICEALRQDDYITSTHRGHGHCIAKGADRSTSGLALGGAMFKTGLAEAVGHELTGLTGARSLVALTFLFSVFAIYFTEVTSNTVTATMLVPLAIAAARSAGVSPIEPAVGCAIGCSMAFMLPVPTPPNAIIYGSGCVPITRMVRAGFWFNIAASLIVPTGVLVMCRLLGL